MSAALPLLVLVFLLQETFTTNIVVVYARHHGVSWVVITLIWFLCTCVDLIIPYYIGLHILRSSLLKKHFKKQIVKTQRILTKYGNLPGIIILSLINFTYINAFVAPMFPKKIGLILIFNFIGNIFWYLGIMAISLVAFQIFNNIRYISLFVSIIAAIATLFIFFIHSKIHRYKSSK